MSQEALKFTDIDSFLSTIQEMGFNGEITKLIFEQEKLPYCTAYFVPINLLPSTFDLNAIDQFGGVITQVQEVQYVGNDDFKSDFMIFPLSCTGYVEVDSFSPSTFVPNIGTNEWATGEMIYIINLEDGGGKEFYLAASGEMIGLSDSSQEEPQQFKTNKQVSKKLEQLRERYAASCTFYAVEQREFDKRRKLLQGQKEQ